MSPHISFREMTPETVAAKYPVGQPLSCNDTLEPEPATTSMKWSIRECATLESSMRHLGKSRGMAYTVATDVNSNCNDDKKQRCTHRFAHIKFKNVPPISIFLRCLQSRLGNPRALLPAGPDYRGHSGVPSASERLCFTGAVERMQHRYVTEYYHTQARTESIRHIRWGRNR